MTTPWIKSKENMAISISLTPQRERRMIMEGTAGVIVESMHGTVDSVPENGNYLLSTVQSEEFCTRHQNR